jgi:hypothetical protein
MYGGTFAIPRGFVDLVHLKLDGDDVVALQLSDLSTHHSAHFTGPPRALRSALYLSTESHAPARL